MRAWLAVLALVACSSDDAVPSMATTVAMRFDRAAFFDAPFPSDDLRDAEGRVHLDGFPGAGDRPLLRDAISLIEEDARGFSLAAGVLLRLDGPIDPARLPDIDGSMAAAATVFLAATDDGSRTPLEIAFAAEEGLYAPANSLSLVPVQGFPLRPKTTYAAVVMRDLGDASGARLGQGPAMRALAAGQRPAGLSDPAWTSYQRAVAALKGKGVDLGEVAGLSVFTTDDPTAGLGVYRAFALTQPLPALRAPFAAGEVFPDYCVYSSTIDMPVYQQGTPPYLTGGGAFTSPPAVDHLEEANVFLTIPRRAQPAAGTPFVVYLRQGGGGLDPLVERGRADATGATVTPGEGPARYLARAGYAGIIVDGPMAGRRNAGADEEFVLFNINNGRALRDSIRQSALEVILMAHVVDGLRVDASGCPGGPAAPVQLDPDHLALMGHSTGAWIAPLALALEPRFKAAVLSGAGGSWIDNMIYKEKPIEVAPVIGLFLGLDRPSAGDPAMTLLQWAAEPADPQVYTRRIVREPAAGESPRHVLMEQGIVDHYILPRIANAVSLSLGLSLAGEPRDGDLPGQLAIAPLLGYAGAARVTAPVSGNRGGVTAVVVQHPGDGIQDAHEVLFQTEAPKQEYRCFLETFLDGVPQVIAGTSADGSCTQR